MFPQEQEQHGHHEKPAFEEILARRIRLDVIDQLGAVVDAFDLHVGRQRLGDFREFFPQSCGHDLAVLAHA